MNFWGMMMMQWIIITMWCDVMWPESVEPQLPGVMSCCHDITLPLLLDQGIASEAHSLIVHKIYTRNLWVFHLLCVQGLMEGRFFRTLFDKCALELSVKSTIYGVRVPSLGETEYNMLNKAWISTKGKSQGSKPRNPPRLEQCNSEICALQFGVALLCVCFFVQWGKGCSRA